MIELDIGDTDIRAIGSTGTVAIKVAGWNPTDAEKDISYVPVDATCSGYLSKFQLSSGHYNAPLTIRSLNGNIRNIVENIDEGDMVYEGEAAVTKPISLPTGEYQLNKVIGMITIYSLISGPANIYPRKNSRLTVIPERATQVTFGFRDNGNVASEGLTVPHTAEGLATAITYFQTGLRSNSPDRSFLAFRAPPPRIDFGDFDIPDSLQNIDINTNIEIVCPETIEAVAATASTAYYLGAGVRVEDVDYPSLIISDLDYEYQLPEMPKFQIAMSDLLEQIFWLDCVVRNAGPYGTEFEDIPNNENLDFDPDQLYKMPFDERLIKYLDIEYNEISDCFPRWSLGATINTIEADLKMLPDLAYQLAKIYSFDFKINYQSCDNNIMANAGPLGERLFGMSTTMNSFSDIDQIGTFHLCPATYESISDRHNKKARITIIRNDIDPDNRYKRFFEEREIDLEIPLNINRHVSVETEDLALLLKESTDYLIFVGETTGKRLVCPDACLSLNDVGKIESEFLLIDSPDSVEAGKTAAKLGIRGAIVGTRSDDWNSIGPSPIGLSLFGFGLADATWFACNFTDSTSNVTVIGDGMATYRATSGTGKGVSRINYDDSVSLDSVFIPILPGIGQIVYKAPGFSGANTLAGKIYNRRLDFKDIPETLEMLEEPVIYENKIFWPGEKFQLINPVV